MALRPWRPRNQPRPRRRQLDEQWMADFRQLMSFDDERLKYSADGHQLLSKGDTAGARRMLEHAEDLKERMDLLTLSLRFPNQQRS